MDDFELDLDPFTEEFDSTDVINKGELKTDVGSKGIKEQIRKDPDFNTKDFSQDDIDQLVNYDHERRKKLSFQSNLGQEIEITNKETDLENNFRDYIVYPKISGNSLLRGDKILIPEKHLKKSSKSVEIVDAPKVRNRHSPATIVVNRDDSGDIDNIEVVCNCGDRILLKFEKADLLDLEKLKLETERISKPIPFSYENDEEEYMKHKNSSSKSKQTNNEENFDDDFFGDESFGNTTNSEKPAKIEEEEFFDDDFGGDIDVNSLGIDLTGIM